MTKREREAFEALRGAIRLRIREWHARSPNTLKHEPTSLTKMRAALAKAEALDVEASK